MDLLCQSCTFDIDESTIIIINLSSSLHIFLRRDTSGWRSRRVAQEETFIQGRGRRVNSPKSQKEYIFLFLVKSTNLSYHKRDSDNKAVAHSTLLALHLFILSASKHSWDSPTLLYFLLNIMLDITDRYIR
jgi:hypothetical protein